MKIASFFKKRKQIRKTPQDKLEAVMNNGKNQFKRLFDLGLTIPIALK